MGRPGCAQCCGQVEQPGQIVFRCACLHTKNGFPQGTGNLDDYWNIPLRIEESGQVETNSNPYFADSGTHRYSSFDPNIHPPNEDKFEYILVIHNWNGKENDQFKMCFNGEDFGIVNPVTIGDYWTHVYGTSDEIIDHFLYGSDKGGGLNVGGVNMNLTPPRVPFDDAQPKTFFNRTIYRTVVNKAPFLMDAAVYGQLYSGAFAALSPGSFAFKFEKLYDQGNDVVVNATILRFDLHTNPGPENFYINGNFRSKVDPNDDRTKDEYDFKTFTFAPGQEFYLPCPLGGDIVQFCDSQFCVNLGHQDPCCPVVVEVRNSIGQLINTVPNQDCESIPELSSTAACACGSSGQSKVCNDSLYFYLNSDNPRSAFNLNDPCPETYYKYPSEVAQNHPISYVRDIFSNIPDSSPEIDTIFAFGDDPNSFFFFSEGPIIYNFIGDPATHSNNTANDCVKDPNTGIVKKDCICCTPIDYDPASTEYRTCPDDNRTGSTQYGIETFNPPENSCSSDQLFFTIPFQGQTVYVEVNFVSTDIRSKVYCHGTERTIEWNQEYHLCDVCKIEQFPQQGVVFNGVLSTVCGVGEFGAIPCRTCPQPDDFSPINPFLPNPVSPVKGASFVYYDNKTSNCIAYFYDEQTGTYTTKIV